MARDAVERDTPARSATCSSVGAGGRAGSVRAGMLSTTVGLPSCGCRGSDDVLATGGRGGGHPALLSVGALPGAGSGDRWSSGVPSALDGTLHDARHQLTA